MIIGLISGFVDLNAITLTAARMSRDRLELSTAVVTIILASISNDIFKSILAWYVGGNPLGVRVAAPILLSAISGLAALWLTRYWPSL